MHDENSFMVSVVEPDSTAVISTVAIHLCSCTEKFPFWSGCVDFITLKVNINPEVNSWWENHEGTLTALAP
jgi:hypothetical protein